MPEALRVLSKDILLEVLDILRDTSPRSLLNVALTSRALYGLSQSFIYRTICFTFNRNRRDINGRVIRRLLTDKALSAKVREVDIHWAPNAKLQPGEGSKQDLELLGKALATFTGLRVFVWDAQYPILSWLLESLRSHHPLCKIYIRHPPHQDAAKTLSQLHLHGLPCLFSFDVTVMSGQYQACRELVKLLSSTPITDLAMDMSFYCPVETQPTSTHLRLRSLEVYSCLFNSCRPAVSWSKLERLSMDSISWLPEVASRLTNLRSLQLQIEKNDSKKFLTSFLRSCQSLEVLDLSGYTKHIQKGARSLWRHLGRTLVKLRYHEHRASSAWGQIPEFIMREIEMIANECPKPSRDINIIANAFWFIVHFEFKLQSPPVHQARNHIATLDNVSQLWTQVWQDIQSSRKKNLHDTTLPRLRSLDVVGDAQLRFTADIAERDDEARRGIAVVRCAELEALKFKLSSAGPLWNREQEKILAAVTERACTGTRTELPITMDLEMLRPPAFWDLIDENRFYHR